MAATFGCSVQKIDRDSRKISDAFIKRYRALLKEGCIDPGNKVPQIPDRTYELEFYESTENDATVRRRVCPSMVPGVQFRHRCA